MITLPKEIANSLVLTPQHLQKLSAVDDLPTIDPIFEDDTLKIIFQYYSLSPATMEEEIHRHAAQLLDKNEVGAAWQVLLSI